MNDSVNNDEEHVTNIIDDLWKYSGIALIVFGTVGHLLSMAVVLSSKSLRRQSTGVFIFALSATGILTLYTGLLRHTIYGYTHGSVDIRNSSGFTCKLHTMLTYMSLQFIAWMQATIALDRVLHVALPAWQPQCFLEAMRWKKGLIIIGIEALMAIALNSCTAFVVGVNGNGHCVKINKDLATDWSYIDLLSFSLIPAVIIILSNTIIIIAVFHLRVQSAKRSTKLEKRRQSLTAMLFAVNIAFLCSTLPISIVLILEKQWQRTRGNTHFLNMHLIFTICSLVQYLGTASTFFIYCLSGSKFRLRLRRMFSAAGGLTYLSSRNSSHSSRISSKMSNSTIDRSQRVPVKTRLITQT